MNGFWRGLAVALAMTLAVWTAVAEGRQGGGGGGGGGSPGAGRPPGGGGGGGYGGGGRGHGGGHGGGGYRHGGGHGHGHWHGGSGGGWYGTNVGLYFGSPWYWGWPAYGWGYPYTWGYPYAVGYGYPYGYPYAGGYGYPYGAFSDASITYVERQPAAPASGGSWYYCQDPAGYFPYVSTCNQPWMTVQPFSTGGAGLAPAQ